MPQDDRAQYQAGQDRVQALHEAMCLRCGACCGVLDGDPCSNLEKGADGKYSCRVYDHRLGPQKTVAGKDFTCVAVRETLKFEPPHPHCPYAKFPH